VLVAIQPRDILLGCFLFQAINQSNTAQTYGHLPFAFPACHAFAAKSERPRSQENQKQEQEQISRATCSNSASADTKRACACTLLLPNKAISCCSRIKLARKRDVYKRKNRVQTAPA
jgi:hypothetical protein